MIPGIDVSHHNAPSAVPWRDVRGGFAFLRATFGSTGVDKAATEHAARAVGEGCQAIGAYHYLKADSGGGDQARHFFERVDQLEQVTGRLAIAVDVEGMPPPHPPWDPSIYTSRLYAFLDVVQKAGRVCAVYIAPWQAAKMGLDARVGACPLWLAHWVPVPKTPKPWSDWQIWQYGIDSSIDRNRYRGSVAELRALFGLDGPALTYDTLGPVTTAVRAAEGRGATVESFVARDEGPVIDGR